jgi:hypothetical protein
MKASIFSTMRNSRFRSVENRLDSLARQLRTLFPERSSAHVEFLCIANLLSRFGCFVNSSAIFINSGSEPARLAATMGQDSQRGQEGGEGGGFWSSGGPPPQCSG